MIWFGEGGEGCCMVQQSPWVSLPRGHIVLRVHHVLYLVFVVWHLAPFSTRTHVLVLVMQCDIISASFYSLEISH